MKPRTLLFVFLAAAFCNSVEASGSKLDGAYRKAANMALAVCLLTDPWGTYIEVSEGLAAVQ